MRPRRMGHPNIGGWGRKAVRAPARMPTHAMRPHEWGTRLGRRLHAWLAFEDRGQGLEVGGLDDELTAGGGGLEGDGVAAAFLAHGCGVEGRGAHLAGDA